MRQNNWFGSSRDWLLRTFALLAQCPSIEKNIQRTNSALKLLRATKNQISHVKHQLKFIYSEKATKFCEIFSILSTTVHTVKSKVKILQTFEAFSEYMNFNFRVNFWWLKFSKNPTPISTLESRNWLNWKNKGPFALVF